MSSGVIRDFAGPYYVSVRLRSYFTVFRQNMEICVSIWDPKAIVVTFKYLSQE